MIRFETPLQWKSHIPKTTHRIKSKFKPRNPSYASTEIAKELRRMKATNCLVTSNMILNKNKSAFFSRQPDLADPGVSVFFDLKGSQKVMQIDLYDKVEDNMWAIYKSVEAFRGLERWGGAQIMDGMFTGFAALPSPETVSKPSNTLYFGNFVSKEQARARYITLAKELHPDINPGKSVDEFQEMKRQYEDLP